MTRTDRLSIANGGFTLVELAVVVAVIALLLGSLLVPLTTQVEQRNVSQTQRQLDEIREAIIGFAMVNGRLPRPATLPTDGRENPAVCATQQACTGYLPWVDLGMSRTDAWGKMYRYSVTLEFANAPFNFSTSTANLKTVQTRDSGGVVGNLATNLAAVVLSYGAENFGKTTDGADILNSSGPPPTNTDEQNNDSEFNTCTPAANCTNFMSRPVSKSTSAAGGEFDDLLVWVPTSILFNRMVAAGKLP